MDHSSFFPIITGIGHYTFFSTVAALYHYRKGRNEIEDRAQAVCVREREREDWAKLTPWRLIRARRRRALLPKRRARADRLRPLAAHRWSLSPFLLPPASPPFLLRTCVRSLLTVGCPAAADVEAAPDRERDLGLGSCFL